MALHGWSTKEGFNMIKINDIYTERLHLRRWKESDKEPFAALNADPVVMEFFPNTLSREESDAFVQRIEERFEKWGFGPWAVELKETGQFIGYVGLAIPQFEAPFMPAVEIGWRLAKEYWGKGYATEAANACLDVAFNQLGLKEIISFTVPANIPSRKVMERLGMTHNPADDFAHPRLPADHPLSKHVLYRITKKQYQAAHT